MALTNCTIELGSFIGHYNAMKKEFHSKLSMSGELVNSDYRKLDCVVRVSVSDATTLPTYTYAKVTVGSNGTPVYYFVEDFRTITNTMIEYTLHNDVLMNYGSELNACDAFIERTTIDSLCDKYTNPLRTPSPIYLKNWELDHKMTGLQTKSLYVLVHLDTHERSTKEGMMKITYLDADAASHLMDFLALDFSSQASFILDYFSCSFSPSNLVAIPGNSIYIGSKMYTLAGGVYTGVSRWSRDTGTLDTSDAKYVYTDYRACYGTVSIKLAYSASTQIDPKEIYAYGNVRPIKYKIILDWATGTGLYKFDTGIRILNFTFSFGTRIPLALTTTQDIRRDQAIALAGLVGSAGIGYASASAIPAISAASSAGQTTIGAITSMPSATPITGVAGTDIAGGEYLGLLDSDLSYPRINVAGWGIQESSSDNLPELVDGWYCGKRINRLDTLDQYKTNKPYFGWFVRGSIHPLNLPDKVSEELERLFASGIYY